MRVGLLSKYLVLGLIGLTLTVIFGQACSEDLGGVGERGRTKSSSTGVSLTPSMATVALGGTQTFTINGGQPPYQASMLMGGLGTVVVSGSNVLYSAPGTGSGSVQIQVIDSTGRVSGATVTVGSGFMISPMGGAIAVNGSLTFTTVGGTPPYAYTVLSGGGVFNLNVFTAPSSPQTVSIRANDSAGNMVQTTITVTAAAGGAGVMFNLISPLGCNGAYCLCSAFNQPGTPNPAGATAICKARGYNTALSFTTQAGPVSATICDPLGVGAAGSIFADSSGCFINPSSAHLVCSTVTCQ